MAAYARQKRCRGKGSKKVEKKVKKGLTKERERDIITKLSARETAESELILENDTE
jgi:hypothetical protein